VPILISGGTFTTGPLVQRLFSAFPEGWPGTGLILLRAIATIPLLQLVQGAAPRALTVSIAMQVSAAICSVLLAVGLWTPIAASLLALFEASLFLFSGGSSMNLMLAVLSVALAMIGPGAWSVDARLFGRKRIRIPQRQ
jgi:putative oxidoreductase